MLASLRRSIPLCALLFGLTAAFAAAAVALPCSEYITSSINDSPMAGYLVGTSTVTEKVGGSLTLGGFGVSTGKEETYEVGYYRFSNGSTVRIDCRDYTYA